jgi:hypothetical protein
LNISHILSFHHDMSDRTPHEEKEGSVQKGSSSPALSHAEGKAAAAWASGAYGGVREHDQAARTPLAAFFNTPLDYSR